MSEREEMLTLNEQRMAEIRARHAKANGPWWYSTTIPEAEHNVCIKHEHTDVYRTILETHDVESKPGMFSAKLETREANVACVLGDDAADVAVMANAYQDIATLFAVIGDRDNEIAALRSQLAAADRELKIAKVCNDSQAEHINTLTLAKQTAERERDEARRERDGMRNQYAMSLEEHGELMRQRQETSSQLWDCMNERDEARRERDALEMSLAKKAESYRASVLAAEAETKQWKEFFYGQCDKAERMEQERDQFASMLHDCENERDGWKHRAERAERVVEAAKKWDNAWYIASVDDHGIGPTPLERCTRELHELSDAVRALDAAEGTT